MSRAQQHVLILAEGYGQHKAFTDVAIPWLAVECDRLGADVTVAQSAFLLDDAAELDRYSLVIQLDFPPYTWSRQAEQNFIRYIGEGRGAWIGFHHATLLGDFDGYPMWTWFSRFMGDIRFQNYVAETCAGKVCVEQKAHPVMQGVSASFSVPDDEWYTYDRSPRLSPDVQVLASVDEDSYPASVKVRMGDHPAVWTNTKVPARNLYVQMGHSPRMMQVPAIQKLLRNALRWTLR